MKPLNRPMFRYGGPIKEGVMSGIREPKKNGGSMMANDEGPRRAALVGNPIYPKGPDGRTRHVVPAILGAASLAGRFIAPAFGRYVMRNVPKLYQKGKNVGKQIGKQTTKVEGFNPNALGRFFANDPLASKAVTGAGYTGKAIQKGYGAAKYATTTPSGLLFFGAPVTYMAGKYFLPDGKEIKDPNDIKQIKKGEGRQFTGDEAMVGDPRQPLPDSKPTLSKEELRKKNVERYRDIMDIKGMNKDAAYNSLIAASQAINQSGDFKGDIKSGKLINEIIQATSKQFDKPKATKDAIDTLILKGEIEKDIKASDPQNQKRAALLEKQIALADKQLAGDSLQEIVTASYVKNGVYPSGSNLAGLARTRGIDVKDVAKLEDVNNFLKANPGKNAVDFIEAQVQITIEQGKPITPGAYVVKDRIIVIDSEGNVSPYL